MVGLIGVGRNTLGQANVGFQQSANLEDSRNNMGDQLRQARAAQRASMVTTGAGLGGSIGVNNAMANAATQKSIEQFGQRVGIDGIRKLAAQETAKAVAPEVVAAAAPEVLTTVAPEVLTTAAIDAAHAAAPEIVAGAVAPAAPAAGVMAIATPLLIGAGAALLLDSLFDIF